MATRKGRTGRKTKSMRRMRTRTKSRRYKMRGGDRREEINTRMGELTTEMANIFSSLKTGESLSKESQASLKAKQAEYDKLNEELENNPS